MSDRTFHEAFSWLTDEDARSDWYGYEMCVYLLGHTKRDGMHVAGPGVDPPAPDLPWRNERRLREERRRYGLCRLPGQRSSSSFFTLCSFDDERPELGRNFCPRVTATVALTRRW